MELESIVANTVYIKAKESGAGKDKGRSRKWKDILKFPHITECINLSEQIVANTFEYIVVNQPIGKKLFWEFCMSKEDFRDLVIFLDKVEVFDLCLPEDKQTLAANVIADHLDPKYNLYLSKIINQKDLLIIDKHIKENENIVDKNLFGKFSDAIKAYLKKNPFDEFLDSIYYKRYLQWKWLELRPVTKNTFRMYRILGKGGFGEVCACQVRATGKLYACKKMEKKRIKKRKGESMALNEKLILQKLNSRFIVTLAYAFESKDSLCLVLTIMNGGDLKFHIHNMNSNGFDEKRTLFYAAEILLGLHHLHSLRIVYRDLKPENILIDDMGHLRISDLGLAVEIDKDATIKGRVGTIGYMAPEVIKNERYTFSPDWFGLGCIVYEMIFGESPFRKRKERVKREEVERRVKEDEEVYNEFFTQNAKSICQALLKKDPKLRLGCGPNDAEEVKNHKWFNHVKWKRMEAGLEDVPFVPDPQAVYAKDVLDIEQFSSIKGVVLDNKDKDFYKGFNTGAISIPWQNEIIETECFAELNIMFKDDNNIVDNLNSEIIPPPASKGCCICSPHRGERSFYST